MTEKKFRVWWPKFKLMMTDDFVVAPDGEIWECSNTDITGVIDGVLIRFTGQPDINEKPIFQGDIIKGKYEGQTIIMPVIWHRTGWYIGWERGEERNVWALHAIDSPEVIGSIYENPELLTP